ncbi:hypothetical protein PBI_SCTP2_37 [Salicola phage SCTP-2]|nr:hypothetical protein PBI_SCTP2_37 [Salicola phage SCTP-2]
MDILQILRKNDRVVNIIFILFIGEQFNKYFKQEMYLMKVKHITQYLFESYKDAQAKFPQEASEEEVNQYLNTFKQLSNTGTISGQEKDIGYWIKQGWNLCKEFVDSKSQEKTKREINKSKKKDSIIVHEDDEKMVVIPLTKDASCYYGKNTKWCTAADKDNTFNRYFYTRNIVLFYIYMKNNNIKYAASYSKRKNMFEYFNELDETLNESEFKKQTGLSKQHLLDMYEDYANRIEKTMDLNNAPEEVQIEVMNDHGLSIIDIDNPTEQVQLAAVKEYGPSIQYIDNPTEKVKELYKKLWES